VSPLVLQAFVCELEKVAAGPAIQDTPTLLSRFGRVGHYYRPEDMEHPDNAQLKANLGPKSKRGVVLMAPRSEIEQVPGVTSEGAKRIYRSYRRHELTHWKRGQKGKLKGVGEPGVRNVLRTAREELVANVQGAKSLLRAGVPAGAIGRNAGSTFVGSMRGAYPGGLSKAMLGGTISRIAKALRIAR
jgi:hypothetical protein